MDQIAGTRTTMTESTIDAPKRSLGDELTDFYSSKADSFEPHGITPEYVAKRYYADSGTTDDYDTWANRHGIPAFLQSAPAAVEAAREKRAWDAAQPDDRGFLGSTAAGLGRGAMNVVGATGQMSGLADATPSVIDTDKGLLDRAGESLVEWAENTKQNTQFMRQTKQEESGGDGVAKSGWKSAMESLPLTGGVAASAAVGAGIGSLIPVVGTAAGATIGGIGGLFGLFGVGTFGDSFDRTYKELKEKRPGAPEEEIRAVAQKGALIDAGLETGSELVSDVAALLTFGGSKLVTQPLSKTLKEIVKPGFKAYLLNTAKHMPFEVGSEMATAYGQADWRAKEGLAGGDRIAAMGESVLPAIFMSAVLGTGVAGYREATARKVIANLNHADANVRAEAVNEVTGRIAENTDDKELAQQWNAMAIDAVNRGQEIEIDQPLAEWAAAKTITDAAASGKSVAVEQPEQIQEQSEAEKMLTDGQPLTPEEMLLSTDPIIPDMATPATANMAAQPSVIDGQQQTLDGEQSLVVPQAAQAIDPLRQVEPETTPAALQDEGVTAMDSTVNLAQQQPVFAEQADKQEDLDAEWNARVEARNVESGQRMLDHEWNVRSRIQELTNQISALESGRGSKTKKRLDEARVAKQERARLTDQLARMQGKQLDPVAAPVNTDGLESALRKSTRATSWGDADDPVAQNVLSSKKQKAEIPKAEDAARRHGATTFTPLTGGASSVVIDAGPVIVRIQDQDVRPRIASLNMLQPLESGVNWEVLPKADTTNITEDDVADMTAALAAEGLDFHDAGIDQLGRVNGKVVVIDPGSVRKRKIDADSQARINAIQKKIDTIERNLAKVPAKNHSQKQLETLGNLKIELATLQQAAQPITVEQGYGQGATAEMGGHEGQGDQPGNIGEVGTVSEPVYGNIPSGVQPGVEGNDLGPRGRTFDEIKQHVDSVHERLITDGVLSREDVDAINEIEIDDPEAEISQKKAELADSAHIRVLLKDMYDRTIRRILKGGGIHPEMLIREYGNDGAEWLRSRFGFNIVGNGGQPLDVWAQTLTEEVPEARIDGDADKLFSLLRDEWPSAKTITTDYKNYAATLRADIAAAKTRLAEREAHRQGRLELHRKDAEQTKQRVQNLSAPSGTKNSPAREQRLEQEKAKLTQIVTEAAKDSPFTPEEVAGMFGVQDLVTVTPMIPQPENRADLPSAGTVTAPAPAEASKKEPWQMTSVEFESSLDEKDLGESLDDVREKINKGARRPYSSGVETVLRYRDAHRKVVQKALSEGKPVPVEVLAEYPDIAPQKAEQQKEIDLPTAQKKLADIDAQIREQGRVADARLLDRRRNIERLVKEMEAEQTAAQTETTTTTPDLTVSDKRRDVPGHPDYWYVVSKNSYDNRYVVKIGHHTDLSVKRLYGKAEKAEWAYDRALAQLVAAQAKTPAATGIDAVVDHFAKRLYSGTKYDSIVQARKEAAEVMGEKVQGGTDMAKIVDEAIELAIVKTARRMIKEMRKAGATDLEIYQDLVALYAQQPNLGVRTSTSVAQQAYSTPVPIAFLASRLAGIKSNTRVLEPTAGNGMLLIEADNPIVNELNPDRAARLRSLGFNVMEMDATSEEFEAQTKDGVEAVVANPPFGRVKDADGEAKSWTVYGYETKEIDHAISLRSLESLPANGKAVLIIGGKQGEGKNRAIKYHSVAQRQFYKALFDNFKVVDHFTVDGKLYAKQGAGFPIDIIVIDGTGKTEGRKFPAAAPPRIYESFEAMEGLFNENGMGSKVEVTGDDVGVSGGMGRGRQHGRSSVANGGSTQRVDTTGGRTAEGSQEPIGDTGQRGTDRPVSGREGAGKRGVVGDKQPSGQTGTGAQAARDGGGREEGLPTQADQADTELVQADDTTGMGGRSGNDINLDELEGQEEAIKPKEPAANTAPSGKAATAKAEKKDDGGQSGTALQDPYAPRSRSNKMGTLVPKNMTTPLREALDRLESERGNIDEYVGKELGYSKKELAEYFAGEQIDAIALAIHNIDKGAGFIIGDQTGIGKGRVNAAIMRYAKRKGAIPVFVTMKPDLYADMVRDLQDIGMAGFNPLPTNGGLTGDKAIPLPDGRTLRTAPAAKHTALLDAQGKNGVSGYDAVFTTYSQLQSVKGKDTDRRAFIRQVAPKAVFILDESHNAGGGDSSARKAKDAPPTTAEFVRDVLGMAERGVFYSSATYAKRPDVMSLYFKTDMRYAVDDISALASAISEGGIPLQQIVAAQLTEAGQYIRRERSFEGASVDVAPAKADMKAAEQSATIMRSILAFDKIKQVALEAVNDAAKGEGEAVGDSGSTGEKGASSTNFTSVMHNLIGQSLLAMKADAAIDAAIEARARGEKPIITLANTMGSFIAEHVASEDIAIGQEITLTFKDLYRRYLEKTRTLTKRDYKGKITEQRLLTDDELGPDGVAAYNDVLEEIEKTNFGDLPISPIDYITAKLNAAGISVGEITGRTATVDYSGDAPVYRSRRPSPAANIETMRAFNGGQLDVIILNQSGSTGISLHSSSTFADKSKRTMIIVQPELNIDVFMQTLGRVFRTGQVVPPAYKLLTSDLPAEKRPAAVLGKKMAGLNANTTASRKTDTTFQNIPDFLNEYGDLVTAQIMEENPEIHKALGRPLKEADGGYEREGAVRRVTGRIPMLPLKDQQDLYDMIEGEYNDLITQLEATGTSTLEAKTLQLDAKLISSVDLTSAKDIGGASPFAAESKVGLFDVKGLGKPYTPAQVRKLIDLGMTNKPDIEKTRLGTIEWLNTRLESMKDPDAKSAFQERVMQQYGIVQNVLERLEIGAPVVVSTKDNTYDGVVVRMEHNGGANPSAPSSWKMTIAIADAARQLVVPLSKLQIGYGQDLTIGQVAARLSNKSLDSVLESFSKGQTTTREKRHIAYGNVLAAYSAVENQGQIINFEDSDGNIRAGIMFKKNATLSEIVGAADVSVPDYESMVKFFDRTDDKGMLKSADKNLRITRQGGYWTFLAPAAKAKGAQFFLNGKLVDAAGRDFVKSGNAMKVTARPEIASKMVDVLRQQGFGIVAGSHIAEAREVMGLAKNEKDGAQYQAKKTPTVPTTVDIRAAFPWADSIVERDGKTIVTKGKVSFAVEKVDSIGADRIAFRIGYGRGLGQNEAISGAYLKGKATIQLSRVADQWTVQHEFEHFLEDMGLITSFEQAVFDAAVKRAEKDGSLKFDPGAGNGRLKPAELRAYFVQHELAARDFQRKTTLGRVLQKVADFVDALVNLAVRTSRGVVRDVESGKVMERKPTSTPQSSDSYQTAQAAGAKPDELEEAQRVQYQVAAVTKSRQFMSDLMDRPETFGPFKALNTQLHKARKSPAFRKLFERIHAATGTQTRSAARAAELAPDILPDYGSGFKATVKELFTSGKYTAQDMAEASKVLSICTLSGKTASPMDGHRLTDDEIASLERGEAVTVGANDVTMTKKQVELYRQARAALDQMVNEMATSQAWRAMRGVITNEDIRENGWQLFADNPVEIPAAMARVLAAELNKAQARKTQAEQAAHAFANANDMAAFAEHGRKLKKLVNAQKNADKFSQKQLEGGDLDEIISKREEKIQRMADELGIDPDDAKDSLAEFVKLAKEFKAAESHVGAVTDAQVETERIFGEAKKLLDAGYAPLSRFGKYRINVHDADGNLIYVSMYDTSTEANMQRRKMVESFKGIDGAVVGPVRDMPQETWRLYQGQNPEALMLFAKNAGADAEAALQTYYQEALSSRSALKRLIKRQGFAGYSTDLQRIVASFITSGAKRVGANYHADDIMEIVGELEAKATAGEVSGDVVDEAVNLKRFVDDPGDAGSGFRSFAANWYMLGSMMSAAWNGTQVISSSIPELYKYNGSIAKTAKEVLRAYRSMAKNGADLTAREKSAVKTASQDGTIDSAEIHHLYGMATKRMINNLGGGEAAKRAGAFLRLWGMPFAWFETVNRKATFLAAFRQGEAMGVDDPYAFAKDIVDVTQGIYSKTNRPNVARSTAGGAVLTFMQYKIMTLEQISRNMKEGGQARKAAALQLAIIASLGGWAALPFAENLMDLFDAIMQIMGKKAWLTKKKLREAIESGSKSAAGALLEKEAANAVGQFVADFANTGISAALPVDVSGRASMGEIVPGVKLLKPSTQFRDSEVFAMAGVPGSMIESLVDASSYAMRGDVGRAAKRLAPNAVAAAVKGVDIIDTGEIRNASGKKIADGDAIDGALQMIGAQPKEKTRIGVRVRENQELEFLAQQEEKSIIKEWADAYEEKGSKARTEAMDDVRARLRDWNARNPEWRIAIKQSQVLRELQNRRKTVAELAVKSAPKELRQSMGVQ